MGRLGNVPMINELLISSPIEWLRVRGISAIVPLSFGFLRIFFTISELLKELERYTDRATYKSRFFPKAPNAFRRQFNRLKPDLVSLGIHISETNVHGVKHLTLEKVEKISPPSPPSGAKLSNDKTFEGGDKGGDIQKGGDTFLNDHVGDIRCQGGDTFQGGDKVAIKKTDIATHENVSSKAFQAEGGDGGDKKTSYSNSPIVGAFQVGDRVRYIGGMVKHRNKSGTIVAVSNDRYRCYWDGEKTVTEYLSPEEITK
jgi:hypothetical protein